MASTTNTSKGQPCWLQTRPRDLARQQHLRKTYPKPMDPTATFRVDCFTRPRPKIPQKPFRALRQRSPPLGSLSGQRSGSSWLNRAPSETHLPTCSAKQMDQTLGGAVQLLGC